MQLREGIVKPVTLERGAGPSSSRGSQPRSRAGKLGGVAALAAVVLALMGIAVSTASATVGAQDLTVTNHFGAWVNSGSRAVEVQSEPSDGSSDLVFDVLVDSTNIKHYDCSCTRYDATMTDVVRGRTVTHLVPADLVDYDPGSLPDGSTHTLTVRLTKYPSREQVTWSTTFSVDTSAPVASPNGEVVWAQNGYLGVGASGYYGFTVGAYDQFSGIKLVTWRDLVGGGYGNVGPGACTSAAPCDSDLTQDITIPLVAEGKHTVVETVTDGAGNVAQSSPATVYVDHTGPAAPVNGRAVRDSSSGQAYIDWDDGGDPALADGSPGSGTDHFQYRYSINGGAWTSMTDTDDSYVAIGSVAAGTPVAIQINGVDAVGNIGTAATLNQTVVNATTGVTTEFGNLYDDGVAANARPLQVPEPTPVRNLVRCTVRTLTRDDNQPIVTDLAGESNIAINGAVQGFCRPADETDGDDIAAAKLTRLTIRLCLQVQEADSTWDSIKCVRSSRVNVDAGFPITLAAAQICKPGSPYYRLQVRSTASGPGTPDIKHAYSRPRALPCNEAGAFRHIATRDGSASTALGNNLNSTRVDPLPQGDSSLGPQGGWEAHHIVPAGEGTGTEGSTTDSARAQRYAYDCGIVANSASNGVWLRGPRLASTSSSFGRLDAAGRRRALHRSGDGVHTTASRARYYTYVANQLSIYVNDSTDACSSPNGAVNALSQIRTLLKGGTVPG